MNLHALTTLERVAVKAQLEAQGFELAPVEPAIITGRDGSNSYPCTYMDTLRLVGDAWEPVCVPVVLHDGGWWKFDGVRLSERVA